MPTPVDGYSVADAVAYWLTYGLRGRDEATVSNYTILAQCRLIRVSDSGFPHIHRWTRPGSVDKAVMVARAARLP